MRIRKTRRQNNDTQSKTRINSISQNKTKEILFVIEYIYVDMFDLSCLIYLVIARLEKHLGPMNTSGTLTRTCTRYL